MFAKLPLPLIIQLRRHSQAWNTMSKSSNFRDACTKKHSKIVGLVGWDVHEERIWTTILDIKAKEWSFVELTAFPEYCDRDQISDQAHDYSSYGYRTSMFPCDGGLVCFVSSDTSRTNNSYPNLKSYSILVCNPRTSMWKTLPRIPLMTFERGTAPWCSLLWKTTRNVTE